MKRIISFVLAFIMLFACVACNGTGNGNSDTSASSSDSADGDQTVNRPFSVGFARVDITPTTLPILAAESSSDYFTKVKDPLYATCIAVSKGSTTALILTLDIKGTYEYVITNLNERIMTATGLPQENIMISATHNHSAPASSDDGNKPKFAWDDSIYNWLDEVFDKMGQLALDAIADLAPATAYTAVEDTTGMAYVRRYLYANGEYIMNGGGNPIAHESIADAELQIIKFDREEKKDIVLSNWQAHVAHAVGYYPDQITSDLVYYVRDAVEKSGDYLYAYYAGASGNINLTAKIPIEGAPKYANYMRVGMALGEKINSALEGEMTKVETGEIKTDLVNISAVTVRDSVVDILHAEEIMESGYDSSLMKKYGFSSSYEVNAVIDRSELSRIDKIPIGAISFGDLAFVSAPYEMFDTSGMEIKYASPFKMTFVLTCAGGNYDYMPDQTAYDHGSYEVYRCRYTKGTAEKLVKGFLDMLNKQKED